MVKFRLSAFSDEYSPSLDEQIEGLITSKIRMTELRGVDGINVSDLTPFRRPMFIRSSNPRVFPCPLSALLSVR